MTKSKRFFAGWVVCFAGVAAVVVAASPVAASVVGEALAAQVSEANYQHYLEDLLYTHLGDNRGFGPEHDLARDNIVDELSSFGLSVELHPFLYQGTTYYNVVGTKTGLLYPDSYYVVGAHFDSVNNPGADDNGSGTAGVMEAARVLSQYPTAYTIKFILFDREEQGLYGSAAYADEHSSDDMIGMLNFDMIAFDAGKFSVRIIGRPMAEGLMNDLNTAIATYAENLGSAVNVGGIAPSDHLSFQSVGVPACTTIEWCHQCNHRYHTANDSVDTPGYLTYAMAADLVRGLVGFLADYAVVIIIPGDFDGDGDVDLDDYSMFAACYNGSDRGPADFCPPGVDADLDNDGDVDLDDFAIFAANYTGGA